MSTLPEDSRSESSPQCQCDGYLQHDVACPLYEDREPPEPDGECYRGGEAASALAEEQARIQRELKR